MKVFIGLSEISSINHNLQVSLSDIGIETDFYNFYRHRFNYENRTRYNLIAKITIFFSVKQHEAKLNGSRFIRPVWFGLYLAALLPFFLYCLAKYDVFIFSYRTSFFRLKDLPILRFFNKTIIFPFLGSDSRPPFINGVFYQSDIDEIMRETRRIADEIRTIEKYATYTLNNPAGAHFQTRPFVQWHSVGLPLNLPDFDQPVSDDDSEITRIVHAPSHPEAKGTASIREAINNLKAEGYEIDYVEIINLPNAVVLEKLATCDFVVDELYSDLFMAVLATEAASFGKPVVVTGYIDPDRDLGTEIPDDFIPPVHFSTPDRIQDAIREMIENKSYRQDLGARAYKFVKGPWAASGVAERLLRVINGDFPDGWLYDPKDLAYLMGAGAPEAKIHHVVSEVYKRGGREAFCMQHHPRLEQGFVDMAAKAESR